MKLACIPVWPKRSKNAGRWSWAKFITSKTDGRIQPYSTQPFVLFIGEALFDVTQAHVGAFDSRINAFYDNEVSNVASPGRKSILGYKLLISLCADYT